MPRKSKIETLAPDLRQAIDVKLSDPRFTLDMLVDHVKAMGLPEEISRSALHRRQQTIAVVGERIRRSKDIADALVDKFGEAPDDKAGRLNRQFVQSAIMDILSASDDDGEPIQLTPNQVMALSKALGELARAEKSDTDRMIRMRKEVASEVANKAADVTERELKKLPGISKDAVAAIRHQVLGVAEE